MTELRERMIEDMRLHGLALTTQKIYLNAVQNLAKHYKRPPGVLLPFLPKPKLSKMS